MVKSGFLSLSLFYLHSLVSNAKFPSFFSFLYSLLPLFIYFLLSRSELIILC